MTSGLGDAIVALLREKDYDLGMKPADIAKALGVEPDIVTEELGLLRVRGEAHPTGFGEWDYGPDPRPPDGTEVDQRN